MFEDGLHRLESPGSRQVVLVTVGVPGVVIPGIQLPPEHVHRHSEVQSCNYNIKLNCSRSALMIPSMLWNQRAGMKRTSPGSRSASYLSAEANSGNCSLSGWSISTTWSK